MRKGFNLIALDSSYQICSLLRYSLLQWTRKYREPGIFSLEIPLSQYSPDYRYVFTNERPEMGVITQVNYIGKDGYKVVSLSGYFMEEQLNRRVVYRSGGTNITNPPPWVNYSGAAEDVAFAFFQAFKDVAFSDGQTEFHCYLGIDAGESLSRGKTASHERCGEYLGNKIYHILQASDMSYRVEYDFVENKKRFLVWSGKDRTENQSVNNPVVFSTAFGNIKDPDILIDQTGYRNGCIVDNGNDTAVYSRCFLQRAEGEDEYSDSLHYTRSEVNRDDYPSEEEFHAAMETEGGKELSERVKTINVEFDAMEGSYEYMEDFDLGDKCNIEIPEMGISAEAVLIGCYEVVKKGAWTLSLEFGTPVIRRR